MRFIFIFYSKRKKTFAYLKKLFFYNLQFSTYYIYKTRGLITQKTYSTKQ